MSGVAGLVPPPIAWLAFPSEYELAWKGGAPPEPPEAGDRMGADDITSSDIALVTWGPPTLQLFAAPGVVASIDCPLSEDELEAARHVYADAMWRTPSLPTDTPDLLALAAADQPLATSAQRLALTLERRQDPWSLPVPGSSRRTTPKGESGLESLALDLEGFASGAVATEIACADGVELLLLAPPAASEVASDRSLRWKAMAMLESGFSGRVSPALPLRIRIQVDPLSPDDRFAFDLSYLDENGDPVEEPSGFRETGPWFRVTVIRTAGVQVYVDQVMSALGREDLKQVVEYREKVVSFCDVPFGLANDAALLDASHAATPSGISPIAAAEALAGQAIVAVVNDPRLLFDGAITVIGFVPNPVCEIATTAYDFSTLITYAVWGTDPLGRPMTRWEAMLTAGGVLLPVSGTAMRQTANALRGVARPGGSVAPRLADALDTSAIVTNEMITNVMLPLGIGTAVAPLVTP